MGVQSLWQRHRRAVWHHLWVLLGCVLLAVGCNSGGDTGTPPDVPEPTDPQFVSQGVMAVLDLYRTAVLQEDIDRLEEILQKEPAPQGTQCRADGVISEEAQALRRDLTRAFRDFTMSDLQTTDVRIPDAAALGRSSEPFQVVLLESRSVEDPVTLVQRTSLFETTLAFVRDAQGAFCIASVPQQRLLAEVLMHGLLLAGAPARVEVRATPAWDAISGVTIEIPETHAVQTLTADGDRFQGVFTPPTWTEIVPLRVRTRGGTEEIFVRSHPQPLRIHVARHNAPVLQLSHRYRLRAPGSGMVAPITLPGSVPTRLFAVAVAPDGTVWSGGDRQASLFSVAPGATRATLSHRLLTALAGRVEDLAIDDRGRVQAVVFPPSVDGHSVMVVDQGMVCPLVNVLSPAYPLQIRSQAGVLQPSPSTRMLAVRGNRNWLFGSDGGVVRIRLPESHEGGECPQAEVIYEALLRREEHPVPSNTVPSLVVDADDVRWLGTIAGVTRVQNEQFIPVPFDPMLFLPADGVTTLETFFHEVAQALFDARPLSTARLGGVSFIETFGQRLIKQEIISGVVEDPREQLWVGTLGGGLRHIEAGQNTLQLTRQEGLGSNLILALAQAPEVPQAPEASRLLWVASEEGVSRLHDDGGVLTITNFSALDGLPVQNGRVLPVRDVAVDQDGTAWLATDGGLWRVVLPGGVVEGVVRDPTGQAIAEVDVIVPGTPYRAATDAAGRFVLAHLPAGRQRVQFNGRIAAGGSFASVEREVEVTGGQQQLEPVVLTPAALKLVRRSGDGQTVVVGRTLAQPLVVAVQNQQGQPESGQAVTFTITAGQGTLAADLVTTDATGQASTTLTLGRNAAGRLQVEASVDGLTVIFTAIGVADRDHPILRPVANLEQEAEQGTFAAPLLVRLLDQFGNSLQGEEIRAELFPGPAAFLSSTVITTDTQGEARFALRVDAMEGEVRGTISAPGLPAAGSVPFQLNIARILVGRFPRALAVADLDGDGYHDLVTANRDSDDVSVLYGRGNGTFVPQQRVSVGGSPAAVAVGDFNRDGLLDLVTANASSNDVSVLYGRGNGTFVPQQRVSVGGSPAAVAVGDFNRDGLLDLVTANVSSNDVSALYGRGDGTFVPQQRVSVGSSPAAVAVGDFNHDGLLDLVTANRGSNNVSVLYGRGNGTFVPQPPIDVRGSPAAVAVGDFNHDGLLDLVTTSFGSADDFSSDDDDLSPGNVDKILVLLGRHDGTFDSTPMSVDVGNRPMAVAVGNFNRDDLLDVVTANFGSDDVSVLHYSDNDSFAMVGSFIVGQRPAAVAVADLNGDGFADLVTANAYSDDISVLLGGGNGTFTAQQRFGVGNDPQAVVAADLNGDGLLDLVTANLASDDISVLLGRDNGTFTAQQRIGIGSEPRAVVVGDLNRDGLLDLVTANRGSDDVSVLLGRGNGTFAVTGSFSVGTRPVAMAGADLNGDGYLDLVTANFGPDDRHPGNVSVLLGRGNGTFAVAGSFPVGTRPAAMAVADLNGDSHLDLITANLGPDASGSDDVSVLLGRGNGTFAAQQRIGVGTNPRAVAVADLNNDGIPDLVTANAVSNNVSVLLGRGNGTFTAQPPIGVGSSPQAVAVADLNSDGILDLVAANASSANVSVLLGRGNGTFAAQQRVGVGSRPQALAVADVNGDGILDLITANALSADVSVIRGHSDGAFAAQRRVGVGSGPQALVVADLDSDDILDLVTANLHSDDVSVLHGHGHGTFAAEARFPVGIRPATVVAADLNDDGLADLVAVNLGLNVRASGEISVLLGQDEDTFAPAQSFSVGRGPRAMAVADLNRDGYLDVVIANAASADVSVLRGRGDGTFVPHQRVGVGDNPRAVVVADFNRDGRLDLVTANAVSADVSVLLGRGDGTFAVRQLVSVGGNNPRAVAVGDFDGDGHLDLVTANYGSADVSVLRGRGNGTFDLQQRVGVGSSPRAVAVADLNGDGRPDLITANEFSDDISVRLGQGTGIFGDETRFIVGNSPSALAVADLDGDDILDLITANAISDDVSVLRGHGDGTFERFP